MTAIYKVTKYLTFIGAIIRSMLEYLVCKTFKIEIDETHPLQSNEMASHIEHDLAPKAGSAFAICFVPTIITQVLALLLGAMPTLTLVYFQMYTFPALVVEILAYWLAISLYLNSFALIEDNLNAIDKIYKNKCNIILKIIFLPFMIYSFIGSYFERYNINTLLLIVFVVLAMVL